MERSRLCSAMLALLACGGAVAAPTSDAEIQKCITDKIAAAPKLSAQGFSASVQNGSVTLTGTAQNPGSKGAATGIAKRCNAKTVSNEISIDKTATAAAKKATNKHVVEHETAATDSTDKAGATVTNDKPKDSATGKLKEAVKDVGNKTKSALAPAMP